MKRRNIAFVVCLFLFFLTFLYQIPDVLASGNGAAIWQDVNSEYVTITVKYLDQSSLTGEEAAIYSPYTARLERGSSFTQSIVSPTCLGFAPYYDSDGDGAPDEDAATIALNYESVTDNVEIKVYYKPIEVNFAVRYFFQNINDDFYTEDITRYHTGKAETGTIISDSDLRTWAGDTTGFEKMYHAPESVAADGSTVFECYYDRNYYLIQFDTDGGFGVDPVYARYGSSFLVSTPTRPGYTFLGWERLTADTDGDQIPDTGSGRAENVVTEVPAQRLYYRALWQVDNTFYSIAYWSLTGDDNEKQYLGARKETNAVPGTVVSGTDDLSTEYGNVFRYEEHTHSVDAGCYGSCPFHGHTHSLSCYTESSLSPAEEQTGTVLSVFQSLQGLVTDAAEGAVYKYAYRSFISTTYYNFFYLDGIWYYLGTGAGYGGISLNGTLSNPSRDNFSYVAASANMCEADSHTHTDDCLSCHKLEHTHTSECNPDPRYYVFDSADQNITVNGDGSTIINIYYRPREYYLRFIYARSKEENSQTKYYVVGGSTYGFGGYYNQSGAADYSTTELLRQVPEGNWGEVEALPQFYPNDYDTNTDISQYNHGTYLDEQTGYTYYYFYFTAYYGENISLKWPIGVLKPVKIVGTHAQTDLKYAYFSAWNGEHKVKFTQDNLNGNQTVTGRQMLLDERLLYDAKYEDSPVVNYLGFWDNGADISWSVPKMYRYRLMLETSGGSVEHNGKYYEQLQAFRTFDNASIEEQEPGMIPGFTFLERTAMPVDFASPVTGETIPDSHDLYFWYTRNTYAIKYFNYDSVLRTVEVPYDTLLTSDYKITAPDYPSSLQPGAYEFAGWYTSPECENGSEVEFDKDRMPAEDVVWYAKWAPRQHTVNFFASYDEMLHYESGDTTVSPYKSYTKNHGSVIGRVEPPTQTGDTDLTFNGWFYLDNGVRKAFSPLSMAIGSDMNIFCDWSSTSLQPYLIQYRLLEDMAVKVADDTVGFAYAGSTRTFTAKAGSPYNQLFDAYNSGYFPTVVSHSITMQHEADKNHPVYNASSFYYVEAQNIEYTVRYVNKETGALMDVLTKVSPDSVVTERFKAYENMVPDAFYKRLELSVEWSGEEGKYVGTKDNVITFYYSPNTTGAYYAVHFMQEKPGATDAQKQDYAIDGSGGYAENGIIEGVGDIGAAISIVPREIAGFALLQNQTVSVIDGAQENVPYTDGHYEITVTQSGTELYIFYERLKYDYTVHYYLYNTTQRLLSDKNGAGSYGDSVTESAPDISNYICVSQSSQTVSIRADAAQNIIVFYYAPVQYVAEYAAVPSDGGVLSNTIEVTAGTEALAGSVPTANMHYSFDGWYLDEACTQSADGYGTTEADTNRFIPDKSRLSETKRNIFYAKFIRNGGDLTIVRTDAGDNSQVFVYEVQNNATGETICVTVVGNGSVTIQNLPFGEYTVTQQNGWSWRYGDAAQTVSHQDGGTTVQFSGEAETKQWLSGSSPLLRNQRGSAG